MNDERKPRPIWGAKAIAAHLNLSVRQVYWKLENGTIPARKVGEQWVSDANQLDALVTGESAQ